MLYTSSSDRDITVFRPFGQARMGLIMYHYAHMDHFQAPSMFSMQDAHLANIPEARDVRHHNY